MGDKPVNTLLDIRNCAVDPPSPPHLAAGKSTQQLNANARKIISCVQKGVKNMLPLLLRLDTLDQSSDRFKNPIPPKPEPMKFAVRLCGATQHKNASDPTNGKTYSGRNCHRATPKKAPQKTIIWRLDNGEGYSLCFFCVSNSAVWQSL